MNTTNDDRLAEVQKIIKDAGHENDLARYLANNSGFYIVSKDYPDGFPLRFVPGPGGDETVKKVWEYVYDAYNGKIPSSPFDPEKKWFIMGTRLENNEIGGSLRAALVEGMKKNGDNMIAAATKALGIENNKDAIRDYIVNKVPLEPDSYYEEYKGEKRFYTSDWRLVGDGDEVGARMNQLLRGMAYNPEKYGDIITMYLDMGCASYTVDQSLVPQVEQAYNQRPKKEERTPEVAKISGNAGIESRRRFLKAAGAAAAGALLGGSAGYTVGKVTATKENDNSLGFGAAGLLIGAAGAATAVTRLGNRSQESDKAAGRE